MVRGNGNGDDDNTPFHWGYTFPGDLHHHNIITLHYAEVVEIRILKCPTLTNYFSVAFHPRCPKFCVELCKLPMNIEQEKDSERKKRQNMQKT